MKKLISVLLVVAMLFAFAACGTQNNADTEVNVDENTETAKSYENLGTFLGNLVGANGNAFTDISVQTSFVNNIFLILFGIAVSMPIIPKVKILLQKTSAGENAVGVLTIISNIAILLICTILLVENTNNPFLYWIF